jgi:Mg/Co/Ni transporter MgtE
MARVEGETEKTVAVFIHRMRRRYGELLRAEIALTVSSAEEVEEELGHLLETLHPEQRRALVELLGADFDFSSLTEVDEAIRMEIVDHLPNAQIAQAVQELDSDDAVYILEDLEKEDQDEILSQLPLPTDQLRRSLDYPEETAGRRMQTEFVAVPPFWTIGQTIDYMREDKNLLTASARYSSSIWLQAARAIDLD